MTNLEICHPWSTVQHYHIVGHINRFFLLTLLTYHRNIHLWSLYTMHQMPWYDKTGYKLGYWQKTGASLQLFW